MVESCLLFRLTWCGLCVIWWIGCSALLIDVHQPASHRMACRHGEEGVGGCGQPLSLSLSRWLEDHAPVEWLDATLTTRGWGADCFMVEIGTACPWHGLRGQSQRQHWASA